MSMSCPGVMEEWDKMDEHIIDESNQPSSGGGK